MDEITRIQTTKRRASLALRSEASGHLHELEGEVLIGRETDCTIQIPSLQISRYHAKINVGSGGAFIEDLASSNGTFVNGRQVRQRTAIGLGDEIRFDERCYRVTSTLATDADPTHVSAVAARAEKPSASHLRSDLHSVLEAAKKRQMMTQQGSIKEQALLKPAPPHPSELGERKKEVQAPGQKDMQAPPLAPDKQGDGTRAELPPASRGSEQKQNKAPEIEDVEAFLRFAGAGLQPQVPLSSQDASPFGLSKRKAAAPPLPEQGSESRVDNGGGADSPIRNASADERPRPVLAPATGGAARSAKGSAQPKTGAANPKLNDGDRDQESTDYLGLNAINRYVSTNEMFQKDLEAGSGPRLLAMTAPIRGKVFPLQSTEDVTSWCIGRDDSADICLRDQAVSREHAWITKLNAIYQLRVSEAASDISVNGQICTEANLRHGDRLQLGAMELVFRINVRQIQSSLSKPSFIERCKQIVAKVFAS